MTKKRSSSKDRRRNKPREYELELEDVLEIKEVSEEKALLFLRKLKGHLKGIELAVEEFLLPTDNSRKKSSSR